MTRAAEESEDLQRRSWIEVNHGSHLHRGSRSLMKNDDGGEHTLVLKANTGVLSHCHDTFYETRSRVEYCLGAALIFAY